MNRTDEINEIEFLEETQEINNLLSKIDELYYQPNPNKHDEDKYEYKLSFTIGEIETLTHALVAKQRKIDAEKYIRDSLNQVPRIKSHDRWRTAAEIMGFKEPNEEVRRRGYKDREINVYSYFLDNDHSPNEAAEKVNQLFKFPSEDACNKWLYDEITRKQNKDKHGFYLTLKKPQKSPAKKRDK